MERKARMMEYTDEEIRKMAEEAGFSPWVIHDNPQKNISIFRKFLELATKAPETDRECECSKPHHTICHCDKPEYPLGPCLKCGGLIPL